MCSTFSCLWETLTFATMETLVLIPKHRKHVIVFKRCTDEIFTIWRKQGECDDSFHEFKRTLNNVSNLDWECEELSKTVNFLDFYMKMNRESKRFECKKHVKKEALAFCMPPHSTHAPNADRGMAFILFKKLQCEE